VRWQHGLVLQLLYVTASVLLVGGIYLRSGEIRTTALSVLIVAAVLTVLERVDRANRQQLRKIDESVGQVWDAGGRARGRQMLLEQAAERAELAVVHEMTKR